MYDLILEISAMKKNEEEYREYGSVRVFFFKVLEKAPLRWERSEGKNVFGRASAEALKQKYVWLIQGTQRV